MTLTKAELAPRVAAKRDQATAGAEQNMVHARRSIVNPDAVAQVDSSWPRAPLEMRSRKPTTEVGKSTLEDIDGRVR